MRNILKILGGGIIAILVLDIFGFIFWILSGQTPPVDSFYIGTITAHALRALFF